MENTIIKKVDTAELEQKVKKMYSDVALNPKGEYHFEMGRGLAEKLGYEKADLDSIPAASIESFAGVGYYFDVANLKEGSLLILLPKTNCLKMLPAIPHYGQHVLAVQANRMITGMRLSNRAWRCSM